MIIQLSVIQNAPARRHGGLLKQYAWQFLHRSPIVSRRILLPGLSGSAKAVALAIILNRVTIAYNGDYYKSKYGVFILILM
ncbi:Uncharacterized protein HZ326_23817 [Fusarium oxysporum f. sp. albedinis]|nr:Uncharacterized protein HZ326_23817 [Fusarium oxysporum f. sp. albedinis]